jgi:alpha-mannosidase
MHDRRREIEARLTRALDERLRPAIQTTIAALDIAVWHVLTAADGHVGEPVPFAVARGATYEPCRVGERWGPPWGTAWFRLTGAVPDESARRSVLDLGWSTVPGFQAEGWCTSLTGGW